MTQYDHIWLISLSRCWTWELAVQDLYLTIRIWSVTQGILSTAKLYLKNCSTKIQLVHVYNRTTVLNNAHSCPYSYRRGLFSCINSKYDWFTTNVLRFLFSKRNSLHKLPMPIKMRIIICASMYNHIWYLRETRILYNLWLCALQDSEVSELSEFSDVDVKYQKVESRLRTASPAPSMEDPDNVVRIKL